LRVADDLATGDLVIGIDAWPAARGIPELDGTTGGERSGVRRGAAGVGKCDRLAERRSVVGGRKRAGNGCCRCSQEPLGVHIDYGGIRLGDAHRDAGSAARRVAVESRRASQEQVVVIRTGPRRQRRRSRTVGAGREAAGRAIGELHHALAGARRPPRQINNIRRVVGNVRRIEKREAAIARPEVAAAGLGGVAVVGLGNGSDLIKRIPVPRCGRQVDPYPWPALRPNRGGRPECLGAKLGKNNVAGLCNLYCRRSHQGSRTSPCGS
jgi:hypothetical protein